MTLDFVRHRRWFDVLSLAIILPGLISLAFPGGLRPGIDFTSGTIMTLRFGRTVDQAGLRQALKPPWRPLPRSPDSEGCRAAWALVASSVQVH